MSDWFSNLPFSDAVSLFSLVLTLIGLSITVWNSFKARSAAEAAERAAQDMKNEIAIWQNTVDLAATISRVEALKGEHRRKNWTAALEKYADLRRDLIAIQHNLDTLTHEQRTRLQAFIVLLSQLETEVEECLADGRGDMDVAKINAHVSRSLDSLHLTLNELRGTVPSIEGRS